MFNKTLFAVGITVLLFIGYLFAQYYIFEKFEMPSIAAVPATAVPVVQQVSDEEERVVSPGGPAPSDLGRQGPGAPNQMPAPRVLASERLPGPTDKDPYDETYGSSNMKEDLRHPERFFGPAPTPGNTSISTASGVAGLPGSTTPQAVQTFSPEFAQNGGEFVDGGIFANDAGENPNYSTF
jgi:hypothetical protein